MFDSWHTDDDRGTLNDDDDDNNNNNMHAHCLERFDSRFKTKCAGPWLPNYESLSALFYLDA